MNDREFILMEDKVFFYVKHHVLIMSENRLDQPTKDLPENQHNFVTEELGSGERIWAAIRLKLSLFLHHPILIC